MLVIMCCSLKIYSLQPTTNHYCRYAIDLRAELPWALASLCVDIRSKAIMFVQPNTVLTEEGGVDLVTYDETPEGVILSVIDR